MRILLAGDSWGMGVWGNHGHMHVLKHPGIDHFMRLDKYDVVNVSQAGANNKGIIAKLNSVYANDWSFDRVFYIQTDPIRDIPENFRKFETKWFDNYEHLISLMNQKLDQIYSELNNLRVPIYMLGGCSTINQELLKKYDNLVCAIPSILKFLDPDIKNPDIWVDPKWSKLLDNKWDLETLDKIIEQDRLTTNVGKSLHFKDDHAHPDLSGYAKVYQYLKKNYLDIDITHKNIV